MSFTSEAEVLLGVAFSHLGDWPNAFEHLDRAVEICTRLAEAHPQHVGFKADLASIGVEQGAALLRAGHDEQAEEVLDQSLEFSRMVLARNPEDTTQRLVTAAASEQLAALAQKRSKPADAQRRWGSALEIRAELAQLEPQNVPAQAALAVALAHAGRRDEAMKKAGDLLKSHADRPAVLLPLARCFAVCAAGVKNEADRRAALASALDALGAAIHSGYRAPVPIRTEPDFAQVRADPAFRKLVDDIKP